MFALICRLVAVSTAVLVAFAAFADSTSTGMLRLKDNLDESRGICVDIAGFRANIDVKVPVQAHTCKQNPNAREDEVFTMNHPSKGNIYSPEYDVCVDVIAIVDRGSVFVRPCSDAESQKFVLADNGELRAAADESLCVAASPTPSHPAVRLGRTPESGVTNVARVMSLAPCDEVAEELKLWYLDPS